MFFVLRFQEFEANRACLARPFKRVDVPAGPPPYVNANSMDGTSDMIYEDLPPSRLCAACDQVHPIGYCRLKLAGVEHCGLCGLAHSGFSRTCPHLNSELQVATMLGALKESTEPRHLVDAATKYLRGIRGDLVHRKKKKELQKEAALRGQAGSNGAVGVNGQSPGLHGVSPIVAAPPIGHGVNNGMFTRFARPLTPRLNGSSARLDDAHGPAASSSGQDKKSGTAEAPLELE